jgi:putative ABC transport system permease protein
MRYEIASTLRGLRRDRLTFVLATIAAGLGVAAATTIFGAVYAVLLRPLPYPAADRLVVLTDRHAVKGLEAQRVPPARYVEWQAARDLFASVGAYDAFEQNLTGLGEPDRVTVARVSPELLAISGVLPHRGRLLTAADAHADAPQVALVGHALWRRALSAGDVEGRTLRLDGQALSVAGVMPERFDLPRADVYLPLRIVRASRVSRHLFVIGRLVDGVDLDSARSRVAERATQMSARHPGTDAGWTTAVTPLREAIVGDVRPALWLLLGAAALVSLIACASVANVLLVRFAARRRDLAIRLALGATRGRLARHLVTEGVIVGSAAGAVGVALTAWLLPVLSSLRFPRFDAIAVDGPVILFAVAAGLAMAVVASGVPVMALFAGELAGALSDGGRSATASAPRRFGAIAVVIQVATAVTLLVGATLLGASLANLARVDPGFRADGVLTTRVVLPRTRYPRGDDMRAFERGLVPALQALPGVRLAAVTSALPLSGRNPSFNFGIHGRPADSHAELQSAGIRAVSPSYFSALGIPLVAGRLFEARDTADAPGVVVINEAMAARFWPRQDPVGERLSLEGPDGPWLTVVGIAGDVTHDAVDSPAAPEMYRPFAQEPWPAVSIVVRGLIDPASLVPAVTRAVRAADPELALHDTHTMEEIVAASRQKPRIWTSVLSGISALALLLALASVFGVTAHAVAQRVPEIAVRMALGAAPRDIMWLVMHRATPLLAVGVTAGAATAWLLTGLISPLLFGLSAREPLVFVAASAAVLGTGLLATYAPARRASRVAPADALRPF